MSGRPLVSVVVDHLLVDALGGVLGPDVGLLLAEVAKVPGHQLQVVSGEPWKAVRVRMDLLQ